MHVLSLNIALLCKHTFRAVLKSSTRKLGQLATDRSRTGRNRLALDGATLLLVNVFSSQAVFMVQMWHLLGHGRLSRDMLFVQHLFLSRTVAKAAEGRLSARMK